jgi:hypothetical protein
MMFDEEDNYVKALELAEVAKENHLFEAQKELSYLRVI